jgi:hypothetical protein
MAIAEADDDDDINKQLSAHTYNAALAQLRIHNVNARLSSAHHLHFILFYFFIFFCISRNNLFILQLPFCAIKHSLVRSH